MHLTSKHIVVVSALREELDYLLADPSVAWAEAREDDSDIWFYEGSLKNTDITLIAASALEMGLTTSAIVATKLITRWQPLLVVMIGICAGRADRQIHLGDIVIPGKIIHYQFGTIDQNRINQKPRVEQVSQALFSLAKSLANTNVLHAIDTGFAGDKPADRELNCHFDPLASADWVVKDPLKLAETRAQDQDVVALDMESYAIVRAANVLKVPYGALIIKSVSDYADSGKSDQFRAYAEYTSAAFLVKLLQVFSGTNDKSISDLKTGNAITSALAASDILILSAQSPDIECLMQSGFFPDAWGDLEDETGQRYFTNTLHSVRLMATSMSTSGLTEAAIITTCAMEMAHPELIVVIGPCGGRGDKVRIGDIILPNKVFHYQYGAFREGQIDSELRVGYLDDRLLGFVETLPKDYTPKVMRQIYESFSAFAPDQRYPAALPELHIAPMASADLVVKDPGALKVAVGLDRKVAAIDMEGYAVMRAARFSRMSPGVLIVRTVADYADQAKDKTYVPYARYASMYFCVSLLRDAASRLLTLSQVA